MWLLFININISVDYNLILQLIHKLRTEGFNPTTVSTVPVQAADFQAASDIAVTIEDRRIPTIPL